MNIYFTFIGYIASAFLSCLLIPQVYKTYKTKNIDGLSSGFLYFQVLTTILWISYGIGFLIENDMNGVPILIANISLLINSIILLTFKYIYK